ncbi:putative PurR-regulated permease PerM [Christiangramia gaetbulicola]|uniref:Putative PurR-regulated permease PerM n=1 Tax=Christiangramia gaetbulicola TaxID=703340 RepID=A0A2T6AH31_9FLAO|nr:AI-2E family transporter [Christiangramia gaetbulicola]PTX43107.1 putative PurR-regulated permease PerM [Christiangramia gaetbulicola]
MITKKSLLLYGTAIVLGTYFLFLGLTKAKGFFAPLLTAIILSLVVLPLSQRMEKKMKRPLAAILNSVLLFAISVGLMALVSYQVRSFAEDWPEIKETMTPKIEQFKSFALKHTPLDQEDIKEAKNSSSKMDSGTSDRIKAFMSGLSSFLANYLLTFVYVFFLLNYRQIFKDFLMRIFPDEKRDTVKTIITKSAKVAPQYLLGKLILMGLLAILYSIGLGISGVDNFILVSVIAAVLTLIPYVGNIIGFTMAVAFGFLTSGDTNVLIGIALTFTITQFVESYVLQPYVVGERVDVHPFFVIVAVILGNMVWGIIGMILAIPIMGIITVVLLNINELKPFGILFSKKEFSE